MSYSISKVSPDVPMETFKKTEDTDNPPSYSQTSGQDNQGFEPDGSTSNDTSRQANGKQPHPTSDEKVSLLAFIQKKKNKIVYSAQFMPLQK